MNVFVLFLADFSFHTPFIYSSFFTHFLNIAMLWADTVSRLLDTHSSPGPGCWPAVHLSSVWLVSVERNSQEGRGGFTRKTMVILVTLTVPGPGMYQFETRGQICEECVVLLWCCLDANKKASEDPGPYLFRNCQKSGCKTACFPPSWILSLGTEKNSAKRTMEKQGLGSNLSLYFFGE